MKKVRNYQKAAECEADRKVTSGEISAMQAEFCMRVEDQNRLITALTGEIRHVRDLARELHTTVVLDKHSQERIAEAVQRAAVEMLGRRVAVKLDDADCQSIYESILYALKPYMERISNACERLGVVAPAPIQPPTDRQTTGVQRIRRFVEDRLRSRCK
jgi:hypothetical protein